MSKYINPPNPAWTDVLGPSLDQIQRWALLCHQRKYSSFLIQTALVRRMDPRGARLHTFLDQLRQQKCLDRVSLEELRLFQHQGPAPAPTRSIYLSHQELTEMLWAGFLGQLYAGRLEVQALDGTCPALAHLPGLKKRQNKMDFLLTIPENRTQTGLRVYMDRKSFLRPKEIWDASQYGLQVLVEDYQIILRSQRKFYLRPGSFSPGQQDTLVRACDSLAASPEDPALQCQIIEHCVRQCKTFPPILLPLHWQPHNLFSPQTCRALDELDAQLILVQEASAQRDPGRAREIWQQIQQSPPLAGPDHLWRRSPMSKAPRRAARRGGLCGSNGAAAKPVQDPRPGPNVQSFGQIRRGSGATRSRGFCRLEGEPGGKERARKAEFLYPRLYSTLR